MTDPNESKNQKPSKTVNEYARYSSIAFQMIAIIVLGTWGGVKLDEKYPNKYSLGTVICSMLSVAIAMVYAVRKAKNFSNSKKQ